MTQPKPLLCSLCCNNPAVYNLALSYQLNACYKLPKILNTLVIGADSPTGVSLFLNIKEGSAHQGWWVNSFLIHINMDLKDQKITLKQLLPSLNHTLR